MKQFNQLEDHKNCLNCKCKSSIFRVLSREELEFLDNNRYELSYKPQETICKQGAQLTHLMVLTSGLASIYLENACKHDLIIKLLVPGDIAGDPGFTVRNKLHYTIKAMSECKACFIDAKAMLTLMKQNNEFVLKWLKNANLQHIDNLSRFITFSQKQMRGKVAEALLYFSKDIFKKNPFDNTVPRKIIANFTALSKESVIRVFKEFKDEGLISEEGKQLTILNMEELEKISTTG